MTEWQRRRGDMIERYADHPLFLDDRGTLPIIVDFDHDPPDADVSMLEDEGLGNAFTLHLIHGQWQGGCRSQSSPMRFTFQGSSCWSSTDF